MLDPRQESEAQTYRTRFTLAHEVAHWILHRTYHSATNKHYSLRTPRGQIACRRVGSFQYQGSGWTDDIWEEWQADHFAGSLLLPAKVFKEVALNIMAPHRCTRVTEGVGSGVTKLVISELSEVFKVSKSAVRVRLKQMDMLTTIEILA